MEHFSKTSLVLCLIAVTLSPTAVQCTDRKNLYGKLPDSENLRSIVWGQLKLVPDTSHTQCGCECLRVGEVCKAFATNDYNMCVLLGAYDQLSAPVWLNTAGDWVIFKTQNAELQMPVFRTSSGQGVLVYNTWLTSAVSGLRSLTTSRDLDLHAPLTGYYKHHLVDNWQMWDITEVSVSLYTNAQEVAQVRINASSTNSTSWFSHSNLISSPWTDLNAGETVNRFTIHIEFPDQHRQFYINSNFGGCAEDQGWFTVLDEADLAGVTFRRFPNSSTLLITENRNGLMQTHLGKLMI